MGGYTIGIMRLIFVDQKNLKRDIRVELPPIRMKNMKGKFVKKQ